MRFAKLVLERYGRFEDCILEFREGVPDLHIVYGANEAGKTTSMAAVADLLFGFGASSPYNFRFDYSLLRVGALIEEDNVNLSVRRRKANAGSLLGADDRPIDENPLLALLRGQTRDTFRLSFSLDQEGLRKGGKAMVQAKDDLGQALFAAGSNLTAVTAELRTLEEEADGIWGKRAAARRTYTVAERDHRESMRSVRDTALKPKEWTDARDAEQTSRQTLGKLEGQRDVLAEEGRRLQRLRRIATFVRTRAAHLAELNEFGSTVAFGVQDETLAEQALAAIQEAERQRKTAEGLRRELEERIAAIVVDDQTLAGADRLEALFEERGAVTKAKSDLQRLEVERDISTRSLTKLREEAGVTGVEVPSRLVVARLRDIAAKAAQTRAALREIVESEETLRAQLADLDIRLQGLSSEANDNTDLRVAVEAASALGDDIDQRCSDAADAATRAKLEAATNMQRLVPWVGSEDDLRRIVAPSNDELQGVTGDLADQTSALGQASSLARRLGEEAAVLVLEIEGLQGGEGAVSAEGLADARADRDRVWQEIRSDIALGTLGPGAMETASAFEGKIGQTDELADRRYTKAEDSGRLAQLITDRRTKLLQSEQALTRSKAAAKHLQEREAGWQLRLSEGHLPPLPPVRLRAWLDLRDEALDVMSEVERLAGVARHENERRDHAIATLVKALGEAELVDATPVLSSILSRATAFLAGEDAAALEHRTLTAERKRIDQDLATVLRRKQTSEADGRETSAQWAQELSATSLAIDMIGSDARLTLFDDVRLSTDRFQELERRIKGIERDAEAHAIAVTEFASQLGITGSTNDVRLDAMRAALRGARAAQTALDGLREDHRKRMQDEEEAEARIRAASASLSPFLAHLGKEDLREVAPAIEGSRAVRRLRVDITEAEKQMLANGDGYDLNALLTAAAAADPDAVTTRSEAVERELVELNTRISEAARAHGDARRAFAQLEMGSGAAIDAATDAAVARAEMEVQAEAYILRRVQAVTLRWAIERYREKHQDPLLARASGLFSRLTLGRYSGLRVDFDSAIPRLLGVSDDGRAVVEVGAMSEGTTDQLFLALRLAALEQSVTSGVRLPFLADDLFVNFDDERARAGFEVLAELARSTQVLFFTHHAHLASIAREVVGAELHSECDLV